MIEDQPRPAEPRLTAEELFRFIDDGCVEINFYGNDGNDNQEKINGKPLLKQYIHESIAKQVAAKDQEWKDRIQKRINELKVHEFWNRLDMQWIQKEMINELESLLKCI